MKIEKETTGAQVLQLVLDVAPEDYVPAETAFLKERRRKADFKGFRKGTAPLPLIRRIYGEQALEEAVNEAVSKALDGYIEENRLHLLGRPLAAEDQPALEWKSGSAFTFKFDLGLISEIGTEAGKDDRLPYYRIEVTAEAGRQMKAEMLSRAGTLVEGTIAGEEDLVTADFRQEGGLEVKDAKILVRKVAGRSHGDFLGAQAGDCFEVDVNESFPDETDRASLLKVRKEELSGLNPAFSVTVTEVRTFRPAEENQETFDRLFGPGRIKTAEEFDAEVERQLVRNYGQEAEARLEKDLKAYFVKKSGVSFSESFLRRWLLEANGEKLTPEQLDKDFPVIVEDYRWSLVRAAFAEKFAVKVEDAELREAAESYAAYQYALYGMQEAPSDMIRDFAQRILDDERQRAEMYDNVQDRKVIGKLREAVTLQEKKVTPEQFSR